MTLAVSVLLSCVEEKITRPDSAEDLGGSYGVYFPSQKTGGQIEFTPIGKEGNDGEEVTEYKVTVEVNRLKGEDEIIVPLVITPDEGMFSYTDVKFGEGQTKTTFELTLSSEAEVGKVYDCSISIEDPTYVYAYSQYDAGIDISAIVVEWKEVVGPNGEKYGRYRDEMLTAAYQGINTTLWKSNENTEVLFEERSDKPGYFRLTDVYSAKFWGPNGGLDILEAKKYFMNPKIIIDATNPERVIFPYQGIGMDYGYGEIYLCSVISEYMDLFFDGFEPSDNLYGTYNKKTGIIEFPVGGLFVIEDEVPYMQVNATGAFRVVLPGFTPVDHSVAMKAEYPENGEVKIDYTFGSHVSKIKYGIYPGVLTKDIAKARAKLIDADSDALVVTEDGDEPLVVKDLEKTGEYTLVTANYDEDGKYADCSFIVFSYIATGEEVPVEVIPELIATNKNSSLGFTAENSLELYVSGKDIREAYLLVVRGDHSATPKEELIENFFTKNITAGAIRPMSDEALNLLNGGGFSDIFYGLAPGYSYTAMIYADNGYKKDLAVTVGKTKGEYDIIYDSFYYDPRPEETTVNPIEDPLSLGGYYDFYAIDLMKDKNVREKIGTVHFEISTGLNAAGTAHIPTGLYVKGLTGTGAQTAGLEDDTMYFKLIYDENEETCYIASQPYTYAKYDEAEEDYVPEVYILDGKIELPLGPGCVGSYSDGTPLYSMWIADPSNEALLYGGTVEGLDGTKALAFACSLAYYNQYGLSFSGMGLFGWDSTYYMGVMKIFSAYDSILLIPQKEDEPAPVRFEKSYRMR